MEILLKSAGGGNPGVALNPNLLHNWYFRNPVNQRGLTGTLQMTSSGLVSTSDTSTVINTSGYFLDRWILNSGTVQITDSGLVLNGEIEQRLEFPVGQETKATVLTTAGVLDAAYDDSTKKFTFSASGATIIAAKLEIGQTQTLAGDESGMCLLREVPDYGVELGKCQRYSVPPRKLGVSGMTTSSANISRFYLPIPVPMRTVPAVIGATSLRVISSAAYTIEPKTADILFMDDCGVWIEITHDEDIPKYLSWTAYIRTTGYSLIAEL